MDHRGIDRKLLDCDSVKNNLNNTYSDEVKPIDGDGLSKSERKLKQFQDEELRKYKKEELETRKVITNQIVEIDPKVLHAHEVNVALYGLENVDLTLVDSIRKKGQLEPIVITDDNIIISGHRRWLALKYIGIVI